MANLSQLILPVKDTITGQVTSQTFDLAGSGGDNTNFIGTKEAYDALPASEKEQYDSMDFTNYQDGAPYDPVPVKASHNIVESGGVYNAIANSNNVVAPVELTLTSTRAYAIGDQFVYGGLLYKATAAIGVGGAITIGTNCTLADCVTKQINDLNKGQLRVLTVTKTISGAANGYSEHLLDFTSSIPSGATVDSIICYLAPYASATQHPTIAQNGTGTNGKTTIWLYQFAAGTINIMGNIFYHF